MTSTQLRGFTATQITSLSDAQVASLSATQLSRFTVAASVPGVGEAEATAGSKQEAETKAAEEFMRRFG